MARQPVFRSNTRPPGFLAALQLGLLTAGLACASAEVRHGEATQDASAKDLAGDDKGGTKTDGPSGTSDTTPVGPCDPFSNAGCPSGQKCTALQSGDSMSLGCGSKGDKGEGAPCSTTGNGDPSTAATGDDCGDGLACFRLDDPKTPETTFTCHRTCPVAGTDHACPTGAICSIRVPGLSGYGFCGPSCKPLEQSGCASGEGCYLTAIGAACGAAGTTKKGDTCDASKPNDCEPGTTCVTGLSNGNRCLAFCSTGGSPACPAGATCTKAPIADVFMPEPNVGYCR